MQWIFILAAFAVGLLIPFQGIINAKLSTEIQNPLMAALISFTGGFLFFVIANLFKSNGLASLKQSFNLPPYLLIGGLIGSVFIISAIFLIPKLGSTAWVALLVAGQMIMSLVLDHYGVLGLQHKSLNFFRVSGAMLLISGAVLISNF
jgi:transporter family-2 protein